MSSPNEKELLALEKIRVRLADLGLRGERNSDDFLLRWLRARDLNVNQAEDMLRKSLAWRAKSMVDKILEWTPPPQLLEEYPYEICGCDNEGRPVAIFPYGKWDVRAIVEIGNQDLYCKYIHRIYERLIHEVKLKSETNPNVKQFIAILDMDGLSYRQLTSVSTVDLALETVKCLQSNYPETVKQAYVINTSRIFTILFGVVKPFLTTRTLAKVQIFGTDPTKWKQVLANQIPVDERPIYFGGKNSSSILTYNSQRPFQVLNHRNSIIPDGEDAYIAVTVAAGKNLKMQYDVIRVDTNLILKWSFRTDLHDIGFSVDVNEEVLVPYSRVESHLSMQNGSVVCNRVGRYTLIFDNTFSRVRSKTLHYSIQFCDDGDKRASTYLA